MDRGITKEKPLSIKLHLLLFFILFFNRKSSWHSSFSPFLPLYFLNFRPFIRHQFSPLSVCISFPTRGDTHFFLPLSLGWPWWPIESMEGIFWHFQSQFIEMFQLPPRCLGTLLLGKLSCMKSDHPEISMLWGAGYLVRPWSMRCYPKREREARHARHVSAVAN